MINESTKFGGFWIRFAAFIIDYALLNLIILPLHILDSFNDPLLLLNSTFFSIVIYWLYQAILHSSKWQATIGKMITGVMVVDKDGSRISFARATGRHFAEILSGLFLGIGYMMAGWKPQKQALHDILAETYVVYGKPETQDVKTVKIPSASDQKTVKLPSTLRFPYNLEVLNGANAGITIPIIGTEKDRGYHSVTIGRENSNGTGHIHFEDPDLYISLKHAEFACKEGICYVRNLSKINPVKQNGTALPDSQTFFPFSNGDRFTLGVTNLRIVSA